MKNEGVIVAKTVSKPEKTVSNRKLWARVCYFYPQYTLEAASKLSVRDIRLLLNTAREIEAEKNFEMVQIVAAPHTEKGKGVKQLSNLYKKESQQ